MEKTYVVIPNNCTGCRTCEVACAAIKGTNGVLGRSRIQILETGKDKFVQLNCLQCVNAACQTVCPTGALRRNEETRAVEHVEALCIRCGLCESACPFGHIYFDTEVGIPLKCDLCNGDPACVRFCPHQALQLR
jgi:carbon-monoxide dehydrogenase iron sulfur subunit